MNFSMPYCILLTTSWQDLQKQVEALRTCQELLDNHHQIGLLFMQYDAVNLANTFLVTPDEELDIAAKWQDFVKKNSINAHICVNSALKRGLLNNEMAKYYNKPCSNLAEGFTLSSLTIFYDALQSNDKFLQL